MAASAHQVYYKNVAYPVQQKEVQYRSVLFIVVDGAPILLSRFPKAAKQDKRNAKFFNVKGQIRETAKSRLRQAERSKALPAKEVKRTETKEIVPPPLERRGSETEPLSETEEEDKGYARRNIELAAQLERERWESQLKQEYLNEYIQVLEADRSQRGLPKLSIEGKNSPWIGVAKFILNRLLGEAWARAGHRQNLKPFYTRLRKLLNDPTMGRCSPAHTGWTETQLKASFLRAEYSVIPLLNDLDNVLRDHGSPELCASLVSSLDATAKRLRIAQTR